MTDFYKLVQDKKNELTDLYKRMDDDRDLVNMKEYTLKDVNERKVPNAISVTLNDLAVFAANVESALGNATERIEVESDDKNVDTHYVEDAIRAGRASADERLTKAGRWPLNPFFDQQMTRRGRAFARVLCRVVDGVFIPDIVYWDARFVYPEIGPEGLTAAAYETYKTKTEIESEAWFNDPKCELKKEKIKEGGTIIDGWDKEVNQILFGKEKVFEQPNPYKSCPVVFQMVPMGSMLADKDDYKSRGESIFFLVRDLIPEMNRIASIIQSLNQKSLDNAMQWKVPPELAGSPTPEYDKLTQPGGVTEAPIGGGAEPVYFGQLKREAYLLHTMIETRIQRGGVSNLDLGIMGNQPWSAVSLITLGEGRDQVFLPRLGARGLLNTQIADMMLEQITNSGETSVEMGTRGHKRTFQVAKLKGEYEVNFKYFIKSPQVDVARYSMAAAAGNLISDKAKRRDILQREDPDEDERDLRWEEAERLSPAVKIFRTIQALSEMAKRGDKMAGTEAMILAAEMKVNLQQMASGNIQQQPKPEKEQKPESLVPLFGQGAGRPTSARRAAELEGTPAQEE